MPEYAMFTNSGKRDVNEDCIGMSEQNGMYCFVLADGLGGHGKGDEASQIMVDSVCCYFEENGLYEGFLKDALAYGQHVLASAKKSLHERNGMMTTAVALTIDNKYAQWAHIGDSRLYMFSGCKAIERTIDDSVPQMLVFSNEIKENMIRHHPDRNKLTKVCGSLNRIIECTESERKPLEDHQAFLLCTDGFWENVYESEMCKTLQNSKDVSDWMEQMVKIAAKRGGNAEMDNFSAIAVII